MAQNVLVYEIQPTDTLNSIANKIGMSPNELLDFHNAHCGEFGLLLITGLAGIRKIVVPKNYKSVAQIRKAITDSLPPRNLSPNFFAAKYQVTESFIDSSSTKIEITYDTEINLPQNQSSKAESFTLEVETKNFKKNGSKPDDKMSELAMACMNSVTPFAFHISSKGKIEGIADFKNLEENFANKKEDLQDFFIGEISTKYMNRFENHLKNETLFVQQYSSNLLHQTLFLNPDWLYSREIWEDYFHLTKNSFPVSMIFTTTHHHINEEKIQTIIKGKSNDEASLQDLLSGRKLGDPSAEPLDATLDLMFITHKTTKQLVEAKADVIFYLQNEIFKEHHLHLLEF